MTPSSVAKRVILANEALLNIGATAFLGSTAHKKPVEYVDEDGLIHVFEPLKNDGDSNDD
jgi:hypothetical protein